jgi:hypothetical protein
MLVVLETNPDFGITERVSADAFLGGWQTPDHFDCLADCRDILLIAASARADDGTLGVCKLAGVALLNLKDRHKATGRLVPTGDELQALRVLVDTSEDFWRRQSGDLYSRAYGALQKHRTAQRAAMKQREAA